MSRPAKIGPEQIRELATNGVSRREAAKRLRVSYCYLTRLARENSIEFKHAASVDVDPRADAMAALYHDGSTLQQIGDAYGLTRERVRQILRACTTVTRDDGGQAVKTRQLRDRRKQELNGRSLERLGITHDEYRRFLDIGREYAARGLMYRSPIKAFIQQRSSAKRRGIGWEITFAQWWAIWNASGKWENRGRSGYVMCRKDDVGPYAPGNVFIATSIENISGRRGRKTSLPTGVSQRRGKFNAQRMLGGKLYRLGTFDTPEKAHAAYLMAAHREEDAA